MTIRDMVSAYALADGTIATLIGTRLYPDMPQKVTYPAGKLFRVDTIRPGTLRNVASLATARLQFDFYCDGNGAAALHVPSSKAVVDAIGDAFRARLDGFGWKSGANVYLTDTTTSPVTHVRAWISIEPESDDAKPEIGGGLSAFMAEYFVKYQTNGGTY